MLWINDRDLRVLNKVLISFSYDLEQMYSYFFAGAKKASS